MARCMLCRSAVYGEETVCPHCGGMVEGVSAPAPTDAGGQGIGASAPAGTGGRALPTAGPPGYAPGAWWAPVSAGPPVPAEHGHGHGEGPGSGHGHGPGPGYGYGYGYGPGPGYGYGYGPGPGYGYGPSDPRSAPRPAPARPTDSMATASLIVAIVALVGATFCAGVTLVISPVAAVMGHVSLRRIARTGADGRGFALTGLILGWLGTATVVALVIVVVALISAG